MSGPQNSNAEHRRCTETVSIVSMSEIKSIWSSLNLQMSNFLSTGCLCTVVQINKAIGAKRHRFTKFCEEAEDLIKIADKKNEKDTNLQLDAKWMQFKQAERQRQAEEQRELKKTKQQEWKGRKRAERRAFKEAWLAIDRQGRGYITSDDLNVYMRKQNYDESFVRKWQKLFDSENTGVIQLEVFCDVLGLNAREIQEQARSNAAAGGGLLDDVIVISGDMAPEWQIKVVEVVKEALRECSKMSDVPKRAKTNLDRQYNQLWHVIIAQGQFWCYYGHEPAYSFVFQIGKQVFIVFKTPQY